MPRAKNTKDFSRATVMSEKAEENQEVKERWYQEEAIEAFMNCIDMDEDEHPLIVAPTGTGKSIIIAGIINGWLTEYPESDVLVLSHTKEILIQDHAALEKSFGEGRIGLYSAGLGRRDQRKITVAGIQSVYRRPELFTDAGLVVIDEAHLINHEDEGMYRSFLGALPDAIYVGLTATHFRTAGGYIHKGPNPIFTKLVYNLCEPESFQRLIDENYLVMPANKGTQTKLDAKAAKIKTTAGDYNLRDMSNAFDRTPVTKAAVKEIVETGSAKYKHWLVFAIDIEHAEHIATEFRSHGIVTACVHSKMGDHNRDAVMDEIKAGGYQAIVNVDILTTGFDFPAIDLIALLCPTKSPVKYVQCVGRGLRPSKDKTHCLILDFGGVVARLGPVDNVTVKEKKSGSGEGEPIMKECPECEGLNYAAVVKCDYCDHEFEFKHGLSSQSKTAALISQKEDKWLDVISVNYRIHQKVGKPNSLQVSYFTGIQSVSEWVCPAHNGRAGNMARHWIKNRGFEGIKTAGALMRVSQKLRIPTQIKVENKGRFTSVEGYKFASKI